MQTSFFFCGNEQSEQQPHAANQVQLINSYQQTWALPTRNVIINVYREVIVTANQSGKHYITISTQFQVCDSTARKIIHKWKPVHVINLPRSGCSRKFTPRLDDPVLRETTRNCSSMLKFMTAQKRLNKYCFFGRVGTRTHLLSKNNMATQVCKLASKQTTRQHINTNALNQLWRAAVNRWWFELVLQPWHLAVIE